MGDKIKGKTFLKNNSNKREQMLHNPMHNRTTSDCKQTVFGWQRICPLLWLTSPRAKCISNAVRHNDGTRLS